MDLTHLFPQRALGKSGSSREVLGGLGRSGELWTGPGRSEELRRGPRRSGEVWGAPERSGKVWGAPERSWEVLACYFGFLGFWGFWVFFRFVWFLWFFGFSGSQNLALGLRTQILRAKKAKEPKKPQKAKKNKKPKKSPEIIHSIINPQFSMILWFSKVFKGNPSPEPYPCPASHKFMKMQSLPSEIIGFKAQDLLLTLRGEGGGPGSPAGPQPSLSHEPLTINNWLIHEFFDYLSYVLNIS